MESLFPDSRTAILESLRRLGVQGEKARRAGGAKECAYCVVRRDGGRSRTLYCAIGILLPDSEARGWTKSNFGIRAYSRPAVNRLAPDAYDHLRAWSALQGFHDSAWEPKSDLSPEQQLKDYLLRPHERASTNKANKQLRRLLEGGDP